MRSSKPGLMRSMLLLSAAAIGGLATAGQAAAQDQQDDEEIVVTGSYIRGTPEDAALPVDVITQDDLLNRGSPTTLELIKTLPVSNGVLGDTNQFDPRAQGSEGSGSVNLRGLGPQRTLVLMNGHRMVLNPFALVGAGAVDTNTIPASAIGRVEVLKDGAAATYGSDAIGGVVNFITRTNVEGLEVGGDYEYINGSDGDYGLNALWGWQGDTVDFLISAGWQHRSTLPVLERDWAHLPLASNPQGGWSAAGSPSTFIPLGATTTAAIDPGCVPLGGIPGLSGTVPVCQWQYTLYDNLTEQEDRYQIFSSLDIDLSDTMKFHSDVLVAHTVVPEWQTSPSYALLQSPTTATSPVNGRFFVPATNALNVGNPGLMYFIASNPGGVAGTNLLNGAPIANIPIANFGGGALNVAGRPYALGGNPAYDYGAVQSRREYDAFRISAGLSGQVFSDVDWDLTIGFGEEAGYRTGRDTVVNRYERALRGYGGPNCAFTPAVANTAGRGNCYYFDPFNYQIPANAITGAVNPTSTPAGYNPSGLNIGNKNPAIIDWFFPEVWTRATAQLTTIDLVFNGDTGISLSGGNVLWALGAQHRQDTYISETSDLSNLAINPCIDSPDLGLNGCAVATGPLGFLGGLYEQDLSRDVNAIFGELSVPITDALQVQLAARWEDYGGETGDTFDPKISVRWQLADWLALRASAGSTFRGPSLPSVTLGSVTSLQNVLGTFRAIDIFGNPNLTPESADTINVGAIIETPHFFATVDYWNFDFQDPLVTEPLAGMVAAMFPNGATGVNNCGNAAYANLLARFTFSSPCVPNVSAGTIARVRTYNINGSPIQTNGYDIQAQYSFDDVMGGTLTFGFGGTYVNEYTVAALSVEGIAVQPAFDAVGKLNYQTSVYPVPQIKGNGFIEWGNDMHNLRLTANYIDSYIDQRFGPGVLGHEIDSFMTLDLNYRLNLGERTTLTAGVQNLTDEDPSFARLDLNYDPFTGDAIGRTIRVGVRQRFN